MQYAPFPIYGMSKARGPGSPLPFCRSFLYCYFRDPTIPREGNGNENGDGYLGERWKELSTVLKISLRWLSLKGERIRVYAVQISPKSLCSSLTKTNNACSVPWYIRDSCKFLWNFHEADALRARAREVHGMPSRRLPLKYRSMLY